MKGRTTNSWAIILGRVCDIRDCQNACRPSLGFSEAGDFAPTQDIELTEQQLDGESIPLKWVPGRSRAARDFSFGLRTRRHLRMQFRMRAAARHCGHQQRIALCAGLNIQCKEHIDHGFGAFCALAVVSEVRFSD